MIAPKPRRRPRVENPVAEWPPVWQAPLALVTGTCSSGRPFSLVIASFSSRKFWPPLTREAAHRLGRTAGEGSPSEKKEGSISTPDVRRFVNCIGEILALPEGLCKTLANKPEPA